MQGPGRLSSKKAKKIAKVEGDPEVRDACIISAAQRVEHYEIASYGSARTYAQLLGHGQWAQLLQQTLDEEKQTDQKLKQLAEGVNVERLTTDVRPAPMSSETLFHAEATLAVPLSLSLETLQERLETLADDLMVELTLRTEL